MEAFLGAFFSASFLFFVFLFWGFFCGADSVRPVLVFMSQIQQPLEEAKSSDDCASVHAPAPAPEPDSAPVPDASATIVKPRTSSGALPAIDWSWTAALNPINWFTSTVHIMVLGAYGEHIGQLYVYLIETGGTLTDNWE